MRTRILMTIVGLMVACTAAQARIKLVALPQRDDTIVRLDNPAATLVEEERVLTLQEGINNIDFSWKGVQIDRDSIRLRALSHPEQVRLLSVSYPPGEAALVWRVYSDKAQEEQVRISYLLRGIDRLVAYKAVADKAETKVELKSYLVLRNFSGEDFARAKCLLDYGEAITTGLNHEETKRILFLKKTSVPITKKFTWDAALKPHDPEKVQGNVGVPLEYVITNDKKSSLGENALWGGKVRVFQDDGHGTTIFLGEDREGFTPVGDEMELYIGDSRDIEVTQRQMERKRINIRRNNSGGIVMYDEQVYDRVVIKNFRDTPATLTLIEHIPGQWEQMGQWEYEYEREDHSTLKFTITVPAHQKEGVTLNMRYKILNVFASNYRQFNRARE